MFEPNGHPLPNGDPPPDVAPWPDDDELELPDPKPNGMPLPDPVLLPKGHPLPNGDDGFIPPLGKSEPIGKSPPGSMPELGIPNGLPPPDCVTA
jgi:hypothetical protein